MDPLLTTLIVQLICLAISEILPFIKNCPNGIVHSLVNFLKRNPNALERTLHETEKCFRATGQDFPAEILHIGEQVIESLNQTTTATPAQDSIPQIGGGLG